MKRLSLIALLTYTVINGCNAPSTPVTSKDSIARIIITPRNYTITTANAFNDLFLDSAAMEKFVVAQKLDDGTASRLRSFYNARNFEFAWLDSKGPIEQASAFRSLYNYSKDTVSNKALDARLDALQEEDSIQVTATDPAMVNIELQLTWRLINYFKDRPGDAAQMVPVQRYPVMQLADSMLQTDDKIFPAVGAMKESLKAYLGYVREGGWRLIPVVKKGWRKGQSSPQIILVKKRLFITGELKNNDSASLFTEELEAAVNTFRNSHGYAQNGVVNDTVINAMNISAMARLQQLLVNMERMKWMPVAPEGRLILVNIPAFVLHVTDGSKKLFDIDIVVGKEGHSTTMFSGMLNQVVFSPYWNIPRSIVRKEILPAIHRNKNYLASRHMEITGTSHGLPVVRQLPGKHNALGRVKFLFPNSYNIYFHDTPDKGLFNRDNRAYSHGCIRLKEPVKLARFVLEDAPEWTDEKIDNAMNSGKQRFVALKHPVPVIITYFTTWLDEGVLHFAEDVYKHDVAFARKLFK
jgi:murein L,D-transpeptidase YcbB/YkuD